MDQAGADALGDGGLWSRSGMAQTGHRGNAREVTYAKISDRALKALSLINILNDCNAI